jgi:hypothetical protein
MNLGFKYSLENFRGLAIIFVMLSHFNSFHSMGQIGELAYFVVGDATAWFVFIAGYLFYYIERSRFNYWRYLLKKAKFVILPYLVLSIPAILVGFYISRATLLGLSPAGYVGWSLLVGGSVVTPLWFIPMICIFFLFSAAFNNVAQTKLIYPLAILGIGFSLFSYRPVSLSNAGLSFLHFSGFYLLGLAFAAGASRIDAVRAEVKSIIVFLSISLFVLAAFLNMGAKPAPFGFFDGLGHFNLHQFGKLTLLLAVFFFFDRYLNHPNKVLGYFAKISFGLFFVHGFYSGIFIIGARNLSDVHPVATFFAEFLLVIIISVATVFLVRRTLKKGSRYVIGC